MNETQIYDKVITLITPYVKNQASFAKVSQESKILEDLGVNSARLVDIVLAFEDEFNIQVEDEVADGIRTVGDAVKLIKQKLN